MAGLVSTFTLGDGSSIERQMPKNFPVKPHSIFEDSQEAVRSTIPLIDPTRYQSSVFQETEKAFQPTVPLTDRSRFDSKIFDPSHTDYSADSLPVAPVRSLPSQLQSQIFREEDSIPTQRAISPPANKPFAADNEADVSFAPNMDARRFATSLASSTFAFTSDEANDDTFRKGSFSGFQSDGRTNRSTLELGDVPRANSLTSLPTESSNTNRRHATQYQSQLPWGDGSVDLSPTAVKPR